MRNQILCFRKDETGVTAVEYGFICALVSVATVGTATIGQELLNLFTKIHTALSAV